MNWELAQYIGILAAIYGGIRADLKWTKAEVSRLNRRIDDHVQSHFVK